MITHRRAMRMPGVDVRCHGAWLQREAEADNGKETQGPMRTRKPHSLVGSRPIQKGISVSARFMSVLAFVPYAAIRASTYGSVCNFVTNQR